MKKKFRISLWSYAPRDEKTDSDGQEILVYKRGDVIGSVVRFTREITIDEAIQSAREMWLDWVTDNKGTQIEVWIHDSEDYPPKVGREGALFYKSNFDAFRPGSRQAMGTPF